MYSNETKIYFALLIGLSALLGLIVFFLITILRYHRKNVGFRRERIKEDMNALEKERERLSIDLHDDLGASLSSIRAHLRLLYKRGDKNFNDVQKIVVEIDELMDRMKGIAHGLMPQVLMRRGLAKALESLISRISDSTGISIRYRCSVDHFDRNNSIHIYRIAQEILNNVIKHSKATSVNFSILKRDGKIHLTISDNGTGFNIKSVTSESKGSGLHNISAHAELMKGEVYLTSAKNTGVTYEIEIPENETKNKSGFSG